MLLYFRLIFVPSVMKRNRKQPNAHDQINASSICCDCNWTESFNHSTLKNANNNNVRINAPDTMTSTERWGPRLCVRKMKLIINCVQALLSNDKNATKNQYRPWDTIEHLAMSWYCALYSNENVVTPTFWHVAMMWGAKRVLHIEIVVWMCVRQQTTRKRIEMLMKNVAQNR